MTVYYIDNITILLMIGIIALSALLIYMFKTQKRQNIQFSLLLIDIFLIIRVIMDLLPAAPSNINLNLHVLSLLILTFALIKLFIKIVIQHFLVKKQHVSVPKILQDLMQLGAFLVLSIIILHQYYKLDTSILVTSSVLSIVIGLALQDTLGNFFSGLALQLQRPFDKGDWIICNNQIGQVTDIDWRAIRVRTLDFDFYTIPNSEIAKTSFMNYSKPTKLHRIVIPMGVHYKSPPNFVKEVILNLLEEEPEILKNPKPSVMLVKYNDFSIDYEIRVFTDNFRRYKEITDSIYTKIWYHFKRNNIIIPFPIRDVYIHQEEVKDYDDKIKDTVEILKTVDFLATLNDHELETIADGVTLERFAAEETIIKQGEAGNTFYIIDYGQVEVLHENEEGKSISLKKLSAPSFFGELSLLTGAERTATVIALTDCKSLTINSEVFKSMIMKNPKITEKISKTITNRQFELSQVLNDKDSKANQEEREIKTQNLLNRMRTFFGL